MKKIEISSIEGIRIGHSENKEGGTGCTVLLCPEGGTGGVEVRGGAPGTRETDLVIPMELVDKVHGIVLSGGSAFGLDASSGVMEYLEKKGFGFDTQITKVPIVSQAVLFDLSVGVYRCRPDKALGYEACLNSELPYEDRQGNVGAGTGATIGKVLGIKGSMKGGLGTYALQVGNLKVGAVVAVNALGDIVESETGKIIAGAINKEFNGFLDTEKYMIENHDKIKNTFNGNTTIGAIITNGKLTKAQGNKIASMAHNGLARAIRPAHTLQDGDTIFTLGTNKITADINVIGILASIVMEKAIVNAVKEAKTAYGHKAFDSIDF